jgi:uncharacterized membrane protein affecting hemolysin expression
MQVQRTKKRSYDGSGGDLIFQVSTMHLKNNSSSKKRLNSIIHGMANKQFFLHTRIYGSYQVLLGTASTV